MLTNKELKKRGRKAVRAHYLLFLILCVIAVMFGNEFAANDGILHSKDLFGKQQIEQDIEQSAEQAAEPKVVARLGVTEKESTQVIRDILDNDLLDGVALANQLEAQFESSGGDVVGHTNGILAYTINTVTSGTLAIHIFEALDKITGSDEAATVIFVILGLLLYILFCVCIPEIYAVVMRRMFMEARVYEKVPLHHAMHLLRVRRAFRATLTIVIKDLFYIFWCFTIVGIVIKRYSYFLVPFIAAENPDIRPLEAIRLSRRMMNGHKFEAFKFELSFLHWLILGVITLGVSNVFWYLPYKVAATTEYYACVRQMAKEADIEGAELLDDDALLAKADSKVLEELYQDISQEQCELKKNEIILSGKQQFFAEKLGVWLGRSTDKVAYQEQENRKYRMAEGLDAAAGLVYPVRLDPRIGPDNRKISYQINFLRCYTIWNLMAMFLLFSFIGWVWEVTLFLLENGEFVNRGTLHGPWIPIYGVGGALIIVVLSYLRKKPVAEFFAIVVLCGAIEFFTSWALEEIHGMRWWDYSGYFLNIDGRICAEGLIAFGVLGMMGIYLLAPAIDALLMKIDPRIMAAVTSGLMAIFCFDVIYSQFHMNTGKGITDMAIVIDNNETLQIQKGETG